jgi:hypothetical protein
MQMGELSATWLTAVAASHQETANARKLSMESCACRVVQRDHWRDFETLTDQVTQVLDYLVDD